MVKKNSCHVQFKIFVATRHSLGVTAKTTKLDKVRHTCGGRGTGGCNTGEEGVEKEGVALEAGLPRELEEGKTGKITQQCESIFKSRKHKGAGASKKKRELGLKGAGRRKFEFPPPPTPNTHYI